MAENWSRRALLVSVGSGAIAGCLGNDDGEQSTESPANDSTDETPVTTATDQPAEPSPPDSIEGSWPMPAADPGRSNYNPDSAGPAAPVTQLWETQTEAELSAPILADESLYLGDRNGGVLALDPRMGKVRWRQSMDSSTGRPWFRDGTLYVRTGESIVALDPGDGTERWRAEGSSRGPDLVASHGLYTVSEATSEVIAFDTDGTRRWRAAINQPWIPTLFASENHVFLSTGTEYEVPWAFDPETGDYLDSLLGDRYLRGLLDESGPEVVHAPGERFYLDGHIYTSDTFYGRVQSYPADKLDRYDWTTNVGPDTSSSGSGADRLAAGSENLYAAGTGQTNTFHAFSLSDGSESWRVTGNAELRARPVVTTENVYVRTADALRCFATADGTERWSLPGGAVGPQCLVVDDILYTADGETVRAFRPG